MFLQRNEWSGGAADCSTTAPPAFMFIDEVIEWE